jgi:hypothetical protein
MEIDTYFNKIQHEYVCSLFDNNEVHMWKLIIIIKHFKIIVPVLFNRMLHIFSFFPTSYR